MPLPLPPQFESLRPFLDWAQTTSVSRVGKRRASSPEETKSFYDAMLARLEEALTYLNGFDIDDMPQDAIPLFHLTLALAEIAPYAEWFDGGAILTPTAIAFENRLKITAEPA